MTEKIDQTPPLIDQDPLNLTLSYDKLKPEERLRLLFGDQFTFHGGSECWYRDRVVSLVDKKITPRRLALRQNRRHAFIYTNGLPGSIYEKIRKISFDQKKSLFVIEVVNERKQHLVYRLAPFIHPDVGTPDYLINYLIKSPMFKGNEHLSLFYANSRQNRALPGQKSHSIPDAYDFFIQQHSHVLPKDQFRKSKKSKEQSGSGQAPDRSIRKKIDSSKTKTSL